MAKYDDDERDVREVDQSPLRHWLIPLAVAIVVVAILGGAMYVVVIARIREAEVEAARAISAKVAMELQEAKRDLAAAKLAEERAQQAEVAANQAVPGDDDAGQPDGKK